MEAVMVCYRPNRGRYTVPLDFYDRINGQLKPVMRFVKANHNFDGTRYWDTPFVKPHSSWDHRGNRYSFEMISLPCGVCFGCRIDNARSWSVRMMHEAQTSALRSWFVTLTYSDDNLPSNGDLRQKDLQDFFKRARPSRHSRNHGDFKYFACQEYGDKNLRPHFHFAGFNFEFEDLRPFREVNGNQYYISQQLLDTWQGRGHVVVGELEWDSAAYIGRYVTKKMRGSNQRFYTDVETGELVPYTVERAFQSKGLGLDYYHQFSKEIWDNDSVLFGKKKYPVLPPRYYFKQLEKGDPLKADAIKEKRKLEGWENFKPLDEARDVELLNEMKAKKLSMQSLLQRKL